MIQRLIVDIYEPESVGFDYPVVTHVFNGKTRDEALGYFEAHLETDAFLRECVNRGRFGRQLKCEARWRWEQAL